MSSPQVVPHSELEVVSPTTLDNIKKSPMSQYSTLNPQNDYPQEQQQHEQYSQEQQKRQQYTEGYYDAPEKVERNNKICGVAPKLFFLVLAALIVVLGIGLGAGVGAGMAVQKSKQTSATPTVTTTSTVTVTSTANSASSTSSSSSTSNFTPSTLVDAVIPTNGTVVLNCPAIDASNLRITLGSTVSLFTVTCGTDTLGPNQDIVAIISYSLSDCAQACASYNRNYGQNKCVAATFNRNLTQSVPANWGTCWLKNGTAGNTPSNNNFYAGLRLQT